MGGGAPVSFFQDQVFVTSSTLATGTAVNLAVTLSSNASASFQNDCCDQSSATVSAQFQLLDVSRGNDPQANLLVNYGAGSFSNAENLGVEVGDTLYLYGSIFASGNANSDNAGGLALMGRRRNPRAVIGN